MGRFNGGNLVTALRYLQRTKLEGKRGEGSPSDLLHALRTLRDACSELPFSPSLAPIFGQLLSPQIPPLEPAAIMALVEALEQMTLKELAAFGFFAVPPNLTKFYGEEGEHWFSLTARQKLRSAEKDMRNACQCYALGQWTASVFHSMRVSELAFRALARHLNVILKDDIDYADWKNLEKGVRDKIDAERQKGRGKAKSDELEFLTGCVDELAYFGIAWRHEVCHARANYDAEDAERVLNRVKHFVERLAPRLN